MTPHRRPQMRITQTVQLEAPSTVSTLRQVIISCLSTLEFLAGQILGSDEEIKGIQDWLKGLAATFIKECTKMLVRW